MKALRLSHTIFRKTWNIAIAGVIALALGSFGLRMAWAAAGDLDPTFGDGGVVLTSISDTFDFAETVAFQADGKIIVGAYSHSPDPESGTDVAVRLCPDGSLDDGVHCGGEGFGTGGGVVTPYHPDVLVQPDGKILAVGKGIIGDLNVNIGLRRFCPNGAPDDGVNCGSDGFGVGGSVVTDFDGLYDWASGAVLQPDGKILVAGQSGEVNDFGVLRDLLLLRYCPDGSLDDGINCGAGGFGVSGKVLIESVMDGGFFRLALQPDGKIVALGYQSTEMLEYYQVVRFCPDGSLDDGAHCGAGGFGSGGMVTFGDSGDFIALVGIELQPDGKIVLGGTNFSASPTPDFMVIRLCSDGTLDDGLNCAGGGFGTSGIASFDLGNQVYATGMVLQPDGKIIMGGVVNDENWNMQVGFMRFCPDGQLDDGLHCGGDGFGINGWKILDLVGDSGDILIMEEMGIQPDGRVVMVGGRFANDSSFSDFLAIRFQAAEEVSGPVEEGVYTFYNNDLPVTVEINPGGLGDIDTISVMRYTSDHPEAGPDLQTGYFWKITALNSAGEPASGFSIDLTLPYAEADEFSQLCRFDGLTWDCAASSFVATESVTRLNVTEFSDWTIGQRVAMPVSIAVLTAPLDPQPVGALVNVSGELIDAQSDVIYTSAWDWGDGSISSVTSSGLQVSGSHVYTQPGIYTLRLSVSKPDFEPVVAEYQYIVVYDPSSGFTTGGGWIQSPATALPLAPAATGKANLAFNCKYKKDSTLPEGMLNFKLLEADFDFSSTSFQWLVVNSATGQGQFKGTGRLNGQLAPNGLFYNFRIWVVDGPLADTFHIRIWWTDSSGDHVVYDNQSDQPLNGGSILVHAR